MNKVDKVMTCGSKAMANISALAILVMMLLVVCDVFMRYLFSKPITGSYEMVSLLMTLVVFFSFAYAQKTKSLVYMTFFMRKLPLRMPLIMWAVTNIFSFGISVLLMVAAFQQTGVIRMMDTTTASLYIPLYPFYFIMGIAFIGFTIILMYDTVKATVAVFNKKVATVVMAEWPL